MDTVTTITTLASIPAILALVNLLKTFGISGRGATVAAILIGVITQVASGLWGDTELYRLIQDGAIMGLGAAGVYDVASGPNGPTPEHAYDDQT